MTPSIELHEGAVPPAAQIIALYRANKWSSADKPDHLVRALAGSHGLVTAWADDRLIGLGNALSDGHLVVYYPHLLVHPDWHSRGIGARILRRLQHRYADFHQQVLIADADATGFYERLGFTRAGATQPMWIYAGNDH